jgi:hypothetical protein
MEILIMRILSVLLLLAGLLLLVPVTALADGAWFLWVYDSSLSGSLSRAARQDIAMHPFGFHESQEACEATIRETRAARAIRRAEISMPDPNRYLGLECWPETLDPRTGSLAGPATPTVD